MTFVFLLINISISLSGLRCYFCNSSCTRAICRYKDTHTIPGLSYFVANNPLFVYTFTDKSRIHVTELLIKMLVNEGLFTEKISYATCNMGILNIIPS